MKKGKETQMVMQRNPLHKQINKNLRGSGNTVDGKIVHKSQI